MEGLSDQVGGKSQQYERRDLISKDRRETWAASGIDVRRDRSTGHCIGFSFTAFYAPALSIPAILFKGSLPMRLADSSASVSQSLDPLA